jgi:hypothetical protein
MADNQRRVPYEERDFATMASNVFHRLCELDEEDRRTNSEPQWQDIRVLAEEVKAYENFIDVAYIAEDVLLERQYIDRDPYTINVRLTALGRQNCGSGINIPPSEIQKLIRIFENVRIRDKVGIKVIRSRKRPKRLTKKKLTKKKHTKKKRTK